MLPFIKKLFSDKRIRFLFAGGINTCVGYGVYALVVFLCGNAYLATTIATIAGVINSYFWNKYFTFKSHAKSISEALRFVLVYAVSFSINIILVNIFIDRLGMNEYLSGFFCLLITTLISYFGHNFFSFKNKSS